MPSPAHGGRQRRRSTKRASASREFVEHDAQSVNVRCRGKGPALKLLGSHVLRSTHHRSRQSDGRSSGGCLYGFGGEAQIHQDRLGGFAARHQHHVVAFEVAMDDARIVRGLQSRTQL